MISVDRISKSFGTTQALRDVSFSLAPGEIVGFLGRNGAGKTTTMRLLTGFLAPASGTVRVSGFDVMEQPLEVKRRIGYLPEHPPLYPEMLVVSYLRFCAGLRGLTRAQSSAGVEQVLVQCGLESVAGRVIGHLSRGYRQRVGLAQALLHDPPVLVLDEPTAALDPGQIHELRQLIRDLGRAAGDTPRTVILSTHRLEDVLATCGRVIVIHRGVLVADESLEDATRQGSLEQRFLALTSDGSAEPS